jgi:hypothetical protein
MEEELLNLIGEQLVKQVKELILTPKERFTKRGNMPKNPSRYNFKATGTLYNSVSYVIRDGEIDILMEDYGVDFVFGEGSRPSKPPPIAPIEKWIRAKGITPRNKKGQYSPIKGMAFAISKNLSKVGYKGYRIFTDKFQTETAEYVETLLQQPQYQQLVLGDIFDRINLFGTQQYNIALS